MAKIITLICIIALVSSLLWAMHIMNKDYGGD